MKVGSIYIRLANNPENLTKSHASLVPSFMTSHLHFTDHASGVHTGQSSDFTPPAFNDLFAMTIENVSSNRSFLTNKLTATATLQNTPDTRKKCVKTSLRTDRTFEARPPRPGERAGNVRGRWRARRAPDPAAHETVNRNENKRFARLLRVAPGSIQLEVATRIPSRSRSLCSCGGALPSVNRTLVLRALPSRLFVEEPTSERMRPYDAKGQANL